MSLKESLDSRAAKFHEYKALLKKAEDEKRELTAEERKSLDVLDGEMDALTAKIEALEDGAKRKSRIEEREKQLALPVGRQTTSSRPGAEPDGQDDALSIEIRGRKLSLKAGSADALRATKQYGEAFEAYLSGGIAGGQGERLGLQVSRDNQGGYLAPLVWVAELIKFLDNMVFMRKLARVISIPGATGIGAPSWDTDPGDCDWTAEVTAADISEDDTARVGKREMMPHLLTKLVKMSRKLAGSNTLIDPVTLVLERLAYKFGITEEKAYLTGTGAQQALGVFTADANGISTGRDVSAASQTAFTADELIDCLYNLKGAYQARATWIFHRDTVKRIRKLKDGTGQYLWAPGLVAGQPSTVLERPYAMSEYAPNTFATGLYVAICGDFSAYWIVDSLALEIQRLEELLTLRNQVGFLGRKETDGMPVLEEAFSRLKLA